MKFFITSESTVDVGFNNLKILMEFEENLNRALGHVFVSKFDSVGIVFVIMNPIIAPPFPEGAILRRSRRELDLKLRIDFSKWVSCDSKGRILQMSNVVEAALGGLARKHLTEPELQHLQAGIEGAASILANNN